MCGIAGLITKNSISDSLIAQFVESIKHRGPDDHGFHRNHRSAIINTRLSIIDIAQGKQPIYSADGKTIVVQNGEIYNYIEVKAELLKAGARFNTNSDTEVILQAYLHYGERFVEKLNGMFAIAIVDEHKNKLFLYRDRLGVKPLYIYKDTDTILFSSEIKSFLRYPGFDKTINQQAIHNYLVFNYVPVPETMFSKVNHLLPGHCCEVDIETLSMVTKPYWQLSNSKEDLLLDEHDYITAIDELLKDAVKIRLRSDVPVGAFLSGGLDSSLVCAYAKDLTGQPFNTYTIGFREKEFDETPYAQYVGQKYGLPVRVKVLEEDIIQLWDKVTWHNDQPHGDISFIPTYILSEFTGRDYKVVLTGDGGDELFAGYTKHFPLMEYSVTNSNYFNSISLFKEDQDIKYIYNAGFSQNVDLQGAYKVFINTINKMSEKDDINKALYFDVAQLLPGNNLVKPDKMAMANGLETRSPFLDYRLFEMLSKIPGKMKLRDGETKYILKKLALAHFSHEHVYRKKQMFTVPVGEWFKGKLRGFLEEITTSESFLSRGILNDKFIKQLVDNHVNNKSNHTRELRAVVNLEMWFRHFVD